MGKEQEYKELFLAEAIGSFEELNKLFTNLEKNTSDKEAVDAIFRITHTLKGNAMGMGFTAIAEIAHKMEDFFGEVKSGALELTDEYFAIIFKANDKLGDLIDALKEDKEIPYKKMKNELATLLGQPLDESADDEEEEEEGAKGEESLTFSDTVQIPIRKLDILLNQVGELIIERDRLIVTSSEKALTTNEFSRLQRITSDLQYSVMDIRLVQIGFLFNKFHRIIRDVAQLENKKVNLELEGTEIEIDRNILKIMSDSLIHIVRNSVSHGIEEPRDRIMADKSEVGTVTMRASNEKDSVIIEIIDDGAGINTDVILKKALQKGIVTKEIANTMTQDEIRMLIFAPGFSSAEVITDVSGRGVGMDVVKKSTESIGGKVEVLSELGKGSTIKLTLPSSMAVKGALLFELDGQELAVALSYTEAVVCLKKSDLHKVGNGIITKYLDQSISILFLKDLFDLEDLKNARNEGALHKSFEALGEDDVVNIIVVSYGPRMIGLVVDKLLMQKEIVEKTLAKPIDNSSLISGATILGNGNVCLTIDVIAISDILFRAGA